MALSTWEFPGRLPPHALCRSWAGLQTCSATLGMERSGAGKGRSRIAANRIGQEDQGRLRSEKEHELAGNKKENEECKGAARRSCRASREPIRTWTLVFRNRPAPRSPLLGAPFKRSFCPVPYRMEADVERVRVTLPRSHHLSTRSARRVFQRLGPPSRSNSK